MSLKKLLLTLIFNATILPLIAQTRVVCIGNSITFGSGIANRELNSYPAQLQGYLGDDYIVENYGVSGTTATSNGDYPYINTAEYKKSLEFKPQIVFIKFGTNDSKSWNMGNFDNFKTDYAKIIDSYKALDSKPRIVLVTPLRCYLTDEKSIYDPRIREKFVPIIEQLAYENDVEIFDGYSIFGKDYQGEMMPDMLHPSSIGTGVIAMNLDRYLEIERDFNFNIFDKISGGNSFNFHGFKGKEFELEGLNFKIVQPKIANNKHSWVLRARFWGHEPQLDQKLLELGFHVVYCNVENLYGAPEAVSSWNKFYNIMINKGLNDKVVLEGMSRGGLIVYNWAAQNGKNVSAIYADAPVMDLKSWPMGEGGSVVDTKQMLEAYKMSDKSEMLAYKKNPIDHAKIIAKLKIPIIHVVGNVDTVVPVKENSDVFAARLRDAGSDMTIIVKDGVGHHPHSLTAPEQILRFILDAEGLSQNYCIKPVRGNEFRSGAGWVEGSEWNSVAQDITETLKTKNVDVLMLGNSITQGASKNRKLVTYKISDKLNDYFKELTWESAGISGDKTQNLLWRIQNGNYNVASPKFVTIAIGVNNLLAGSNDANSVFEGILAVTDAALKEFPNSKVILFGLLPTAASDSKLKDYYHIQTKLKKCKFDSRVIYIDPSPYFTEENGYPKKGLYSGDMIHLQEEGYKVWASLIYDTVLKNK